MEWANYHIIYQDDKIIIRLSNELLAVHEIKEGKEQRPLAYLLGFNAISLKDGKLVEA